MWLCLRNLPKIAEKLGVWMVLVSCESSPSTLALSYRAESSWSTSTLKSWVNTDLQLMFCNMSNRQLSWFSTTDMVVHSSSSLVSFSEAGIMKSQIGLICADFYWWPPSNGNSYQPRRKSILHLRFPVNASNNTSTPVARIAYAANRAVIWSEELLGVGVWASPGRLISPGRAGHHIFLLYHSNNIFLMGVVLGGCGIPRAFILGVLGISGPAILAIRRLTSQISGLTNGK